MREELSRESPAPFKASRGEAKLAEENAELVSKGAFDAAGKGGAGGKRKVEADRDPPSLDRAQAAAAEPAAREPSEKGRDRAAKIHSPLEKLDPVPLPESDRVRHAREKQRPPVPAPAARDLVERLVPGKKNAERGQRNGAGIRDCVVFSLAKRPDDVVESRRLGVGDMGFRAGYA